jgi:hypothetical protein
MQRIAVAAQKTQKKNTKLDFRATNNNNLVKQNTQQTKNNNWKNSANK